MLGGLAFIRKPIAARSHWLRLHVLLLRCLVDTVDTRNLLALDDNLVKAAAIAKFRLLNRPNVLRRSVLRECNCHNCAI
jgi:hypothetical protein